MKNLLVLLLLFYASNSISCTTFVIKDSNNLVFGRNLDWFSDIGIVVVNKRNINKTSLVFPPEKSINWKSKYGSVTFNQFGKEFPFGGINEVGLVVEIMVVNTLYPEFDQRSALNELQWVQYQLDNCSTINEVIQSDKLIRISKINQDLHFLICDKFGNTAVIEFSEKGMVVYKNEDLPIPVLENSTYPNSLKSYNNNEPSRFSIAAKKVKSYNPTGTTSIIDYSFNILNEVTLDSSWSIVYDIKNMQIHFKTASNRKRSRININDFNFSCESPSLIFDLTNKKKRKTTINHLFIIYKKKLNMEIFDEAIKSNQITLPQEVLDKFYNYNERCECQNN